MALANNQLLRVDPNELKYGQIKETINMLDKKISSLKGDKAYATTVTKLSSLRRDFDKAYDKLYKYFKQNPQLVGIKNDLSIREINRRASNGDPLVTRRIDELKGRKLGSNAMDNYAKFREATSTVGAILKGAVGVALSLTGIGLIAGIPLLKSAMKTFGKQADNRKQQSKIKMELEDLMDKNIDGASSIDSTILKKGQLTPEQIDFLMDNKTEFDRLMDEATKTTGTLKLTPSQKANLLSQLNKVVERKKTVAKSFHAQESQKDFEEDAKKIGVAAEALDTITVTNPTEKAALEARKQYLLTGDEKYAPKAVIESKIRGDLAGGRTGTPEERAAFAVYQSQQNIAGAGGAGGYDSRRDAKSLLAAAATKLGTTFNIDELEGPLTPDLYSSALNALDPAKKSAAIAAISAYNTKWQQFENELAIDLTKKTSEPDKYNKAKAYTDARKAYRNVIKAHQQEAIDEWAKGTTPYTTGTPEADYDTQLKEIAEARERMRKQGKTEKEIQEAIQEQQTMKQF